MHVATHLIGQKNAGLDVCGAGAAVVVETLFNGLSLHCCNEPACAGLTQQCDGLSNVQVLAWNASEPYIVRILSALVRLLMSVRCEQGPLIYNICLISFPDSVTLRHCTCCI